MYHGRRKNLSIRPCTRPCTSSCTGKVSSDPKCTTRYTPVYPARVLYTIIFKTPGLDTQLKYTPVYLSCVLFNPLFSFMFSFCLPNVSTYCLVLYHHNIYIYIFACIYVVQKKKKSFPNYMYFKVSSMSFLYQVVFKS